MSNSIVVYHKGCPDGVAAAWCFWNKFGDSIEYIPGVYQPAIPLDLEVFRHKTVYCVDFSYPVNVVKQILEVCDRLMILDHHKTFMDTIKELPKDEPRLDTSHCNLHMSGAIIAWEFLNGWAAKPPLLLQAIEDRDLWLFKHPFTREVCAYLFSKDFEDFKEFDRLLWEIDSEYSNFPAIFSSSYIITAGRALIEDQDRRVKKAAANALAREDHWLANVTPDLTSALGDYLCKVPLPSGELPNYAHMWCISGTTVYHSLRSKGFDVSVIALEKGGGGHQKAAGWKDDVSDIF